MNYEETEDDRRHRIQSEMEAAEFGPELIEKKKHVLASLLTTYSDADAVEKLSELREWFWGIALPPDK